MKRSSIFILIALLLALITACDTSSNVDTLYKSYFIKTFGGDGDQEGVDILVNNDNTITMLGNSTKPTGESVENKIYFLKTDFSGKILIEKELGYRNERAMDIEPIPNGYAILSNVFVSADRFDIKLLRTDLSGVVIDSVVIDSLGDQYGSSVTYVSDGRFFVIGNTRDTDVDKNAELEIEDQEDLLIVELDNSISVLSMSRIGKSSIGKGIKIFENASTFTYAGYSDDIVSDEAVRNTNFVFRTFNTDPNSATNLYVGDNVAQEKMSSFIKMPNGSFYGIGTEISAGGLLKVFIANVLNVKDNTTPNEVPIKIFSQSIGAGRLEGVSGYPSSGGDAIFVLANEYDEAEETRNLRLLKVNVFGSEVWSQQFGSVGNDDVGNAVAELPNGDVVIVGTVNLINQQKLTMIRVNSKGRFH